MRKVLSFLFTKIPGLLLLFCTSPFAAAAYLYHFDMLHGSLARIYEHHELLWIFLGAPWHIVLCIVLIPVFILLVLLNAIFGWHL